MLIFVPSSNYVKLMGLLKKILYPFMFFADYCASKARFHYKCSDNFSKPLCVEECMIIFSVGA